LEFDQQLESTVQLCYLILEKESALHVLLPLFTYVCADEYESAGTCLYPAETLYI